MGLEKPQTRCGISSILDHFLRCLQIEQVRAEGSALQQQLKAAMAQRDREGAAKSLVSQQLVRCQGRVQELQLQLERARGDVQQAEARGREDAAAERVGAIFRCPTRLL